MDQVNVFHKFHLVHSWIPWAIYSPQQHQSISQKENFYRIFFHLENLSPIYHLSWILSPLVKLITLCRYFWLTVLLSTPSVNYSKHSFLRLIFKNLSVWYEILKQPLIYFSSLLQIIRSHLKYSSIV